MAGVNAVLVVLVCWASLAAAGTDDLLVDALVAEEQNCTRANQTFELARMCKKDVIERLFLYIAMQQLHIARRKEKKEDNLEQKKKKEEDDQISGRNMALLLWLCAIFFFYCMYVVQQPQ